jgi:hypothetical protein|tara:strand:+ start:209 stop:538 length:330 start_codon:yes stop_codon:yes gene_type:complete
LVKRLLLFIIPLSFYIASATEIPPPNITIFNNSMQIQKIVFYNNGNLFLKGFNGPGAIEIYSIIGNKISNITVQELENIQLAFALETRSMYIIRVITEKEVETYKIITP